VPFPTPVSSTPIAGRPARRRHPAPRRGIPVVVLLTVAVLLGAATAVLGPVAALVALGLGCAALLTAGVFAVRAQWHAMVTDDAADAAAVAADRPAPDPTEELRSLRDRYVAAVDTALDQGDLPRARELADTYADDALRVLTR